MKTIILIYSLLMVSSQPIVSQDIYSAKSSKIHFFAGTPMEDIEADNSKASSFLNTKTGEVLISIPNKEFKFKSSLMEEHFNENYMESEKYPKSDFKGKILEMEKYDFSKPSILKVKILGNLTIHGVTKSKTIDATITISDSKLKGETKFTVNLSDFNIQRPQLLWEKLSEVIEITSLFNYEVFKK